MGKPATSTAVERANAVRAQKPGPTVGAERSVYARPTPSSAPALTRFSRRATSKSIARCPHSPTFAQVYRKVKLNYSLSNFFLYESSHNEPAANPISVTTFLFYNFSQYFFRFYEAFFPTFLATAVLSGLAPRAWAQSGQTLTSAVQSDTGEALPRATVFISGTYQGASCNSEGLFIFSVSERDQLPLVLSVSFVGFETQSDTVRSFDQPLKIVLAPSRTIINEVVVSASRTEERSLQVPATVDKLNTQ